MKRRVVIWVCVGLLVLFLGVLFFTTGFLQKGSIDERDIEKWERDGDGVVLGAREFVLEGNNETCWYLIHGYTSTPDEMRGLAERISEEFGDEVVVARLEGNGELPSHILDLSLSDWYAQVLGEFDVVSDRCEKVNLVGFSFGGVLSSRIAEERDANHVYLLAPYLFATYNYYHVFRLESYVDLLAGVLHYIKKTEINQINSPEGLAGYISYWNMPLAPVKNSVSFIEDAKRDLSKIAEPVLLQQSENDKTSDIESSVYIYDNINSEEKDLIVFTRSNHCLLADYDKDAVIENIINFEKELRG